MIAYRILFYVAVLALVGTVLPPVDPVVATSAEMAQNQSGR